METGDVLVAKITPCFENNKITVASLDRAKGFGSTEFHVIRVNASVLDNRYLVHFLRQDSVRSAGQKRMTGSAGQRRVPRLFLEELSVPLPPLDEQRRIAAILDQADDLRRKRRGAIDRLGEISSAILKETTNRADQVTASQLCNLIRGEDRINYGVVQPGPDVESGIPLIRVENVVDNAFGRESLKHIAPEIEAQYKRSRLRGDEILVACVGSIGAVALATSELQGFNIARAVARLPIDPTKADRIYVASYLCQRETQAYFRSETRAVAQPTLNIKQLCETPMLLPPIEIQRTFADQAAEIDKLKACHRAHLTKLDALFASLQHRAFRGEL